ncbi:MAG TPA: hypothetical protein VHB72_04565 [Candidatus Saccharimonadales bacterium]|nr:hypothetical protein [Candidatus Saccharimonadales bacterium]
MTDMLTHGITPPEPPTNSVTPPETPSVRTRSMNLLPIVLAINAVAALAGAIIAYPTSPASWLNSLLYIFFFTAVFGAMPYALTMLVIQLIAKKRQVKTSARGIALPILLYAPVLGFTGYIMSYAFYMADHQESGSEFMPLILLYIGVMGFWVIPLLSFIVNLVLIFRQKKIAPATPAQPPVNTAPPAPPPPPAPTVI